MAVACSTELGAVRFIFHHEMEGMVFATSVLAATVNGGCWVRVDVC